MGERQNTIACAFDLRRPRISAYKTQEWIYAQLRLEDNEIPVVQIDGPKRHVYVKLLDNNRLQKVLHLTGGQIEYRHTHGEISMVRVETAGLGMRRLRIATLPPEVSDITIAGHRVLVSYEGQPMTCYGCNGTRHLYQAC